MIEKIQMNVQEALQALGQGHTLMLPAEGMLVRMENRRILCSSANAFFRLGVQDFLELFARSAFFLRPEHQEINELKDQEYYAWRREKQ